MPSLRDIGDNISKEADETVNYILDYNFTLDSGFSGLIILLLCALVASILTGVTSFMLAQLKVYTALEKKLINFFGKNGPQLLQGFLVPIFIVYFLGCAYIFHLLGF